MSYENWKDKIGTFEVMDVRGKKMDLSVCFSFFASILLHAACTR